MSSAIAIVQITEENYPLFDDMAFRRLHGRVRSEQERAQPRDYGRAIQALTDPNLMVYAAVLDKRFVGWISLIYMPKVGRTKGQGYLFVDELWTHPDHRRMGIARQLIAHAEAVCAQRQALGIRLVVSTENREAIHLYQECGFVERDVAFFMEKNRLSDTVS
jgi:ribosomal protein S18 acetylase RimI-like enzyme